MIASPALAHRFRINLEATFVSLLPRIEACVRLYFRDVRCTARRADCMAEAVALSWKWFRRLIERGKDATKFVSTLALLAARAVRSGRKACRQERAGDVMNPVAQRRHNFTVESLGSTRTSHETLHDVGGQRMHDAMEERLRDNSRTPPPEQAAFRIDFPEWLKTLSRRDRKIIRAMAMSERTKELSQRFGVSWGRISQMRREFKNDWERFIGEELATA